MDRSFCLSYESPVGFLILKSSESTLQEVIFANSKEKDSDKIPEILHKAKLQLSEYFSGNRFDFDLELEPSGTEFQKKVWNLLLEIPFGETTTYQALAKRLGSATYTRAVGLANGKNPIPVIIPCHRVVGADGKMVGFAGGVEKKKMLLLHELGFKNPGKLF